MSNTEQSPLRCYNQHPENEDINDGQHYNEDLRAAVATAIQRYPNSEAEWWIGPEAVLHKVEKFLGWDQEADEDQTEVRNNMNDNDKVTDGMPNTVPEEKWLKVWWYLREAQTDDNTFDVAKNTWQAVVKLYELLEPPSVSETRRRQVKR